MNPRPTIERIAGVMVPLFSIRTRADAGIGDIAALAAMTDLAAAIGHRAVLLLPLDETAPGEASPYSALSVFAIDPIYIGLEGLAGVDMPSAVLLIAPGINYLSPLESPLQPPQLHIG